MASIAIKDTSGKELGITYGDWQGCLISKICSVDESWDYIFINCRPWFIVPSQKFKDKLSELLEAAGTYLDEYQRDKRLDIGYKGNMIVMYTNRE